MTDFLIGRQEILTSTLDIYAYEILFRGRDLDLATKESAARATNQVITDTLLEIGLQEIVGPHKAFINFTEQNILEKTPLNLPKDRIVIEVLENVTVTLPIINNLRELSLLGYTIALDDFVLTPEWLPLIEFADIIKLDVMAMSIEETAKIIEQLKSYKLTLLAEKVQTHAEFEALKAMGCELFQGFFFSKPNIVEGKRLGINQTAAIKLLSTINKNDVSFTEISKIISQDVGLSYKLLHYINSAFFALPNKIESIQHAIACLGLVEVKRWVNILTLSSLSNKPVVVLQNALIRAKMCELLAEEINEQSEHFFLVGMFSSLDSILDMPMTEVLTHLPLAEDIIAAILHHSGIAGLALQYTLSYERWELADRHFQNISQQEIAAIYLYSINWAKQVLGNIH